MPDTHERAMTALGRLPTTSGKGQPASVRTATVFGHAPCGLSFPLNRKTAENNVETIPLDGLEPRQEFMPVAGLKSYIVRSRRDPPDVVRLRTRDGRERLIVQEGHTRLAAALLRGDDSMPVRVWEFVESPLGKPEPVARGRHEIGDRQRRRVAEPYRTKMQRLSAEWGFSYDLYGTEKSGNYDHEGRPGQVGGSAPDDGSSGPTVSGPDSSPFVEEGMGHERTSERPGAGTQILTGAAAEKEALRLSNEWSRINNEYLEHIDNPESAEYKQKLQQLKDICKQLHRCHHDTGGLEGIGKPGGPRDVVIIGAGPGGLSASINGGTEGLDTLFIEASESAGGQAKHSSRVENYPGFPGGVKGRTLAERMQDQAERNGAEGIFGVRVENITFNEKTNLNTVHLSDGRKIETRSVIVAAGLVSNELGIPGEQAPTVSHINGEKLNADGKGKSVIVIGGGNSAAQAALGAAKDAKDVTIIARSPLDDGMSKKVANGVRNHPKITIVEGDGKSFRPEIAAVDLDDKGNAVGITLNDGRKLTGQAVGIFIGQSPATDWMPDAILEPAKPARKAGEKPPPRRVKTDEDFQTAMPGVFAVGDVRAAGSQRRTLGRVGAAVGEGQTAIANVFQYFAGRMDAPKKHWVRQKAEELKQSASPATEEQAVSESLTKEKSAFAG